MGDLNTGGGGSTGHDVNTGGGDFAGRDRRNDGNNVTLNFDRDRQGNPTVRPTLAGLAEAQEQILWLIDGNQQLGIVGIRTRARQTEEKVLQLTTLVIVEGVLIVGLIGLNLVQFLMR